MIYLLDLSLYFFVIVLIMWVGFSPLKILYEEDNM